MFEDALQHSGGPWVFGQNIVADDMFAPLVSRFRRDGITLSTLSRESVARVLEDPPMQDWYSAAAAETDVIEKHEILI